MDLLARTCSTERMNVARLLARAFVIVGGLVWAMMLFASETAARYGNLTYSLSEVVEAGFVALLPFSIAVLVFVIGLFYERLAALLLLLAAVATVAYGFVAGWEGAVLWANILLVIVSPLVVAAVLFLLAASTQRVCELEGVSVEE